MERILPSLLVEKMTNIINNRIHKVLIEIIMESNILAVRDSTVRLVVGEVCVAWSGSFSV